MEMLYTDHEKKLKDLGCLVKNLQWFVGILNVFSFFLQRQEWQHLSADFTSHSNYLLSCLQM